MRPRLKVRRTGYRPGLGVAAGTNLTGSLFNDFALGLFVGDVVGRIGVVWGYQWIGANEDLTTETQHGIFMAVDYTF
jgi:hypothetical protein